MKIKSYEAGYKDGYIHGKSETTIQLINEYYGNGYEHSWFWPINWYRRNQRIKLLADVLWEQYGPTYEDENYP